MAVTELLGETTYEWQERAGAEVVEPWSPAPSSLLLLLLLLLLPLIIITIGVVVYFRRHKQPWKSGSRVAFQKGKGDQTLPENEEPPAKTSQDLVAMPLVTATQKAKVPADLPQHGNGSIEMDPTYDNMTSEMDPTYDNMASEMDPTYDNMASEDIYENISRHIPRVEVEAYLNRSINSFNTKQEFESVPAYFNKSMNDAQHPSNKKKNRYRNNHPYDETRVKLTVIGDDPQSDYINANHVPGYGNMRYAAAQGPKDERVPTIADFWRMVIEQDINVIIMVANFIEGGKNKVGEYLKVGSTLEFDGHYVSVISREQLPHFTVSSVQVLKNGYSHNVKHYHYSIWPDHGIPNEAVSIAGMIQHYQTNHHQGGTVVHCSAGIGRTGTVLLVLLMCEMLEVDGSFDPLEALKRLRSSRARLVENQAQYNLGLEILEEILFGDETIVSAHDLETCLDKYLQSSLAEFRKIKALPSALTYKSSSSADFQAMNRNRSVLPADTQRTYLQMEHGLVESQYINAVRVAGLDSKDAFLVTEHPLPGTLAKFWRLVVEKGSTHIILINHFDEQSKEFPDVMPEVGGVWTLAGYTIHVQQAIPYGNMLLQFIVNLSFSEALSDRSHTVQVYQVLSWPYGHTVPSSPEILLTLAELLLQVPRHTSIGPPLLCCGDGVTGCGLVAATTLLVERLQTQQCVNVYRTVVKLLRCRSQFITTEEQYSMLYSGAATYIKDYSTYGNFN